MQELDQIQTANKHQPHGDAEPVQMLCLTGIHGNLEACALLAQAVMSRHADIVHDNGTRRLCVPAQLILRLPKAQPSCALQDKLALTHTVRYSCALHMVMESLQHSRSVSCLHQLSDTEGTSCNKWCALSTVCMQSSAHVG